MLSAREQDASETDQSL